MDELKAFADGRLVTVAILDLEKPVTGRNRLELEQRTITGKAEMSAARRSTLNQKLTFKGDKACSAGKGEKPSCHFIESAATSSTKFEMT
ncbi:hypothetical protein [Rhizobium bangladeshense]|uniref:hypothetical protein n=1 Tax=Rhizobium bangladeshense TaxID=1138189 RepID=UPI002180C3B1|nr:hypothetical protein [Rhizobium bangladeshense]